VNSCSATLAIDKVWQQCLHEHSLAIRVECQAKLDEMRKLLQRSVDALLGMEASFDQADEDRTQAWQARDELNGRLAIEREARARCEADLVFAREKAEMSSKTEAITGAKLEAALLSVQTLEAEAADLKRRHQAQEDELARARADSHAADQQAEQYRHELVRLEDAHEVESRVNVHHFEKMYAILEYLAERDPQAMAFLNTLRTDSAEGEVVPTSRLGKVLSLLTRKKAPPPLPPEDLDPPDSVISF
jgi:chromosome segregation ATPase